MNRGSATTSDGIITAPQRIVTTSDAPGMLLSRATTLDTAPGMGVR